MITTLLSKFLISAPLLFGWNVQDPTNQVMNFQLLSGYVSGNYVVTNLTGMQTTNEVTTNGTNLIQYYCFTNPMRGVSVYYAVSAIASNGMVSVPSMEITNIVPLPNAILSLNQYGIVTISNIYPGGRFILQSSSDMKTWKNKLTFTATNKCMQVGSDMDDPQRFLRVVSLPFVYSKPSTIKHTNNMVPPPAPSGSSSSSLFEIPNLFPLLQSTNAVK